MIKNFLINIFEKEIGLEKVHAQIHAEKFLSKPENQIYEIFYKSNGGINLRTIKCSCKDPKCESGISFDSNEDESINYLRYTDRYNNMHVMEINKETAQELINQLKQIK